MKPLTKFQPYLWRELDGTPSIVVIDTESGSYYRASEADARIRHWQDEALCAEEAALSHAKRIAELEAERDSLKVDRSLALEAVATAEAERGAALQAVDDLRAARAEVAELEKAVYTWRRDCEAARAVADEQLKLAHKMGIALDVVSRGPDTSGMTVTINAMPAIDAARGAQ